MTVSTFYSETDWQSSSGPYLNRQLATGDIWPEGAASEIGGGDKDDLEDGMHQAFAVGAKANRPLNPVGVTVSYNSAGDLIQMNFAPGFLFKAYVANVLTYSEGSASTFDTSLAVGDAVYVDDSDPLDAGVTLSRSPSNSAASTNPRCGYIWYNQDEYLDSGVGGANTSAGMPKTVANELTNTLVTVMLWPDQY